MRAGELLVFDGGYGTALFAAGLLNGACPELWNDTHPDVVRGIHKGYFDAGSDFVETNTFGGRRLKLNEYAIGDRTRELNDKGARLARVGVPPGRLGGWIDRSDEPTARRVRAPRRHHRRGVLRDLQGAGGRRSPRAASTSSPSRR